MNSKGLLPVGIILLIAAVGLEFMMTLSNPGVYAAAALFGCGVLVIIGNYLLRPLLQRAEDYYGGGDDDE